MNAEQIQAAYQAGEDKARQMVPGVRFVGAMVEADAYAARGTLAHRLFMAGFIGAIPSAITTDRDGIIVAIGE